MDVALLIFLLFWVEAESKLINDCYWLADQFMPSPQLFDLKQHRNFHLLPLGKCGNWKSTPGDSLKKVYQGTSDVSPNEFPWVARMSIHGGGTGQIQCGGVLISERYILTAAHCCERANPPSRVKWFLGSDYLFLSKLTVATEKMHIPEGYSLCQSRKVSKDDICLVRLADKIQFNDYIKPICVPDQADIDPWMKMEVAGYGLSDPDSMGNKFVLQKKTVTVVSQSDCRGKYSVVDAREICTTFSSCRGISGWPLMKSVYMNGTTAYWLFGISSYGESDCPLCGLSVYTRVTEYIDWILDLMEP